MGEVKGESTGVGRIRVLCLLGLLALGVLVRLPGLADDPPGFHTMRQLHSATVARSMHLDLTRPSDDPERMAAVHPTSIEPPINEVIVTGVYAVTGGERLWVARAMSIVYWTIGAAALWAILRRFTNLTGQIVGVAFYQLAPIGIEGGRSFQPDALMLGIALVAMLLQVRLVERPSLRRAVPAVGLTAAALIVKPVAVPIVLGFWAGLLLWRHDWRKLVAPRVIAATVAMVVPAAAVYAWLVSTNPAAGGYGGSSFFLDLFGQRSYYEMTMSMITRSVTMAGLVLALVSTLLVGKRRRRLLGMLWLSYIAYNIPANYRTATHDYYHLPLVFIVALALGMGAQPVQEFLEGRTRPQMRFALAAIMVVLLVVAALFAATTRNEAFGGAGLVAQHRAVGELLGPGTKVLAVTFDYGSGLEYYGGLDVRSYPTVADDHVERLAGRPVPTAAEHLAQTDADFLVVPNVEILAYFEDLTNEVVTMEPFHHEDPLVIWDLRNHPDR